MKVPVEWINGFLERKLTANEMAEAMERAGVEVEEIIPARHLDRKIVVGRVIDCEKHPNADRLKVTKVDVGGTTLSIVCGAPNVRTGLMVAVAKVGTTLPDETVIEAAELRGVESQGMICSERELGISNDHIGILELGANTELGVPLSTIYSHTDVIDATSSANRWDLTSIIGIAREVAAHTGQNLIANYPEQIDDSPGEMGAQVDSNTDTRSYVLVRLKVDAAKPTPHWLSARLQAAGVRPINVVVDITNYIMLEYGQPLHAFDAHKIEGSIKVRAAGKDEVLTTLDGKKRSLDPEDVVISDDRGAIGLAGVMGGANSEIDSSTTEIILEAAVFDPARVRKTAARHGLRSDASARFERGVPPELPRRALAGAARDKGAVGLLMEYAVGELLGGPTVAQTQEEQAPDIAVKPAAVSRLLGLSLDGAAITKYLQQLNFETVEDLDTGVVNVTPPWWRRDVTMMADVAEEVIKLIGYDKLPATLPAWHGHDIAFDGVWSPRWRANAVLLASGLFEIVTYSFTSRKVLEQLGRDPHDHLRLTNPLSQDQEYMRSSLLPSLLEVVARNRTYAKEFGVYELAKVYRPTASGQLPDEPYRLGIMALTENGGYRRVKGVLDRLSSELNVRVTVVPGVFDERVAHPTQSAIIEVAGKRVGVIGRLHPELVASEHLKGEVGYMEIDWLPFVIAARPKLVRPMSKFPGTTRDISVILDRAVTWAEVRAALDGYEVAFVSDYYGSDLPEDKKSLSLRIMVRHLERTPTEKDAVTAEREVQAILVDRFRATPRS